jgi:hypothetical protein
MCNNLCAVESEPLKTVKKQMKTGCLTAWETTALSRLLEPSKLSVGGTQAGAGLSQYHYLQIFNPMTPAGKLKMKHSNRRRCKIDHKN